MFPHTKIIFTRHIMLFLQLRNNKDSRTLGGIFFEYCDEPSDIKFMVALLLIIDLLKQSLYNCFKISEDKINKLLEYFFELLANYIKRGYYRLSTLEIEINNILFKILWLSSTPIPGPSVTFINSF